MYYGFADVTIFRPDLPILMVRAGLDRPAVNSRHRGAGSGRHAQNAPLTLLNHSSGAHAFEISTTMQRREA